MLWAIGAGVGFGLFQSINRRALTEIDDAYLSTFVQLVVAAAVLVAVSLLTEDVGALAAAPAWSIVVFAAAGVVHFILGWTFLNLSQQRIGAARTAPLLTMTPLFGLMLALLLFGRAPEPVALLAMVPVVAGAYVLSGGGQEARGVDAIFGLATALMWAVSAVLTVEALDGLASPLLGVTLGMVAAVPAYTIALLVHRARRGLGRITGAALGAKIGGAVLLALATWLRLVALDHAAVAVVLALNLLSVPVVLAAAPWIAGRHLETVTARVWMGSALVLLGTLSLIAIG